MQIVVLSDEDIDDISVCSFALSSVDGAGRAYFPRRREDLLSNGGARVSVPISSELAGRVLDSRDALSDNSHAHRDAVLSSDEKRFVCIIRKIRKLWTSHYVADMSLSYYVLNNDRREGCDIYVGSLSAYRMTVLLSAAKAYLSGEIQAVAGTVESTFVPVKGAMRHVL